MRGKQRSEISPRLDLSTASVLGQVNGIVADEIGRALEDLEVAFHGFDPDMAEGFLLTSLGKLTGTPRRGASNSIVVLECDLEEDTVLLAGINFAAVDGDTESLWTPNEDFTAPSTGTHEVEFRALETGAITAAPDTITVIQTTVPGWTAVTNPEEAQAGRPVDDDPTLRERREAQLTAAGSATAAAIRADILTLENVISCTVFENDSDDTVDGMPPHSVEALVFDGESPVVDDDEIAQKIWDSKAAGIQTVGSSSGTAVDYQGNDRTVYFSRPEIVEIYLSLTVTPGVDYVDQGDDAGLALYISEQCALIHVAGDDVKWRRVDSIPFRFGVAGVTVEDVTAFTLDTSPAPGSTANIPITDRQIAAFDASRIVITS
jgi:hypothetical protein